MPIDSSSFNILEKLVSEQLTVGNFAASAPRMLVRRRSISAASIQSYISAIADHPKHPAHALMQDSEVIDWAPFFRLDNQANRVERQVVELDFATYSDLRKDSHRQIIFGFSVPIPTEDGHLIYCYAYREALWAWDFFCRFEGAFEAPKAHYIIPLWQS